MRVLLVAHTSLIDPGALNGPMAQAGYVAHPVKAGQPREAEADELAEFAGRLCYQSWDRPNPATATNDGYLANIIRQGHFSVLEHASASLYVDGVSRSFLAEITRHRHLSFSVLSQRYVDESDAKMVNPPAFQHDRHLRSLDVVADKAREQYRLLVEDFVINYGLPRKQAREAARSVLPNATETKLLVSGNLRAWREVIQRRISKSADAEIQEFAESVLSELKTVAPNTFQDLEVF